MLAVPVVDKPAIPVCGHVQPRQSRLRGDDKRNLKAVAQYQPKLPLQHF
jgi:hypothetical protein